MLRNTETTRAKKKRQQKQVAAVAAAVPATTSLQSESKRKYFDFSVFRPTNLKKQTHNPKEREREREILYVHGSIDTKRRAPLSIN